MKKILSLLGAVGMIATSSVSVIACGPPKGSVLMSSYDLGEITLTTTGNEATATLMEVRKAIDDASQKNTDFVDEFTQFKTDASKDGNPDSVSPVLVVELTGIGEIDNSNESTLKDISSISEAKYTWTIKDDRYVVNFTFTLEPLSTFF